MKVAVVTPYYEETAEILLQCLDSVANQTYPARHFMVADGAPSDTVSNRADRGELDHIALHGPHQDNGNVARCVGAISAISRGFDAIAFLDADNWFRRDHIDQMVELHNATGAEVCTSGRAIHHLDGSLLYVDRKESDGANFADTSCLFFTRPAFSILPLWGLMPRDLSAVCDQVIWAAVLFRKMTRAHRDEPSVRFRSKYKVHYQAIGVPPPAGTKDNPVDTLRKWSGLPATDRYALLNGTPNTTVDPRLAALEKDPALIKRVKLTFEFGGRSMSLMAPEGSGTRYVASEIFEKRVYREIGGIGEVKNILDIGANIGIAAGYFRHVHPDAKIWCVEPDRLAHLFLQENAKVIKNCAVFNVGLHGSDGNRDYYVSWNTVLSSTVSESQPEATCIDAFFREARSFVGEVGVDRFDIIKVDTEGSEVPIILNILDVFQRAKVVYIEFHNELDGRLIREMLQSTHELRRSMVDTADRGTLTFVRRDRMSGGIIAADRT